MQKVIFDGNIGKDAELKQDQNGQERCVFPVGCTQGYGDNKRTNWYRCTIFGKSAQSLQPYLVKGSKVGIVGNLRLDEYEGKTQLNVVVDNDGVTFMSRSETSQRQPTAHDKAKANGYQPDNILDDDMPF
jgi:single-strand DNA-binding protein